MLTDCTWDLYGGERRSGELAIDLSSPSSSADNLCNYCWASAAGRHRRTLIISQRASKSRKGHDRRSRRERVRHRVAHNKNAQCDLPRRTSPDRGFMRRSRMLLGRVDVRVSSVFVLRVNLSLCSLPDAVKMPRDSASRSPCFGCLRWKSVLKPPIKRPARAKTTRTETSKTKHLFSYYKGPFALHKTQWKRVLKGKKRRKRGTPSSSAAAGVSRRYFQPKRFVSFLKTLAVSFEMSSSPSDTRRKWTRREKNPAHLFFLTGRITCTAQTGISHRS